jgi:hypothetical protein
MLADFVKEIKYSDVCILNEKEEVLVPELPAANVTWGKSGLDINLDLEHPTIE